MWPMLAGIGPVLGTGRLGAFVDPDGRVAEWYYRGGRAGVAVSGSESAIVAVEGAPYELTSPDPYVAVLTGPGTASAGDAVATAFRGRPRARSFGQGTYGVSTANRAFPLPDSAVLVLTVSRVADRTGRVYGGVIPPDEEVEVDPAADLETDPVAHAAAAWLATQSGCS